jgi:hypothetical protein
MPGIGIGRTSIPLKQQPIPPRPPSGFTFVVNNLGQKIKDFFNRFIIAKL